MAHRFDLRVYYSHTDAGGIVYHARYLDFAEHARTELFRHVAEKQNSLSAMIKEQSVGFVVKSLNVEYHSPSYLDDQLYVLSTVKSSKRFSLTFLQQIFREDLEIATLQVKVAAIDLKTQRPILIESWLSEAIERL